LNIQRWSIDVIEKAHDLLAYDKVRQDTDHPSIWWVDSATTPGTIYRVQSDLDDQGNINWVTCTCAHGRLQGGGATKCAHALAVLLEAVQWPLESLPLMKARMSSDGTVALDRTGREEDE